jgi:hypothetical protein
VTLDIEPPKRSSLSMILRIHGIVNLTISSRTRSTGTSTTPGQSIIEEFLKKQSAMLQSSNCFEFQKYIKQNKNSPVEIRWP